MVARMVRDHEAASSSLATSTIKIPHAIGVRYFYMARREPLGREGKANSAVRCLPRTRERLCREAALSTRVRRRKGKLKNNIKKNIKYRFT